MFADLVVFSDRIVGHSLKEKSEACRAASAGGRRILAKVIRIIYNGCIRD